MRALISLAFALVFATLGFGQSRFGGAGTPFISGGFPNAVFPGGTPANSPNITRFTPNYVFPGGGGPRLVVPGKGPQRYTGTGGTAVFAVPYAYPVYVPNYDPSADPQQAAAPPQQPNTTVVFPPSPAPVIVRQYADQDANGPEPVVTDQPQQSDDPSPDYYLIALKDHTIYSVVAYWLNGDTLHYFTSGNVHNQVSLSLVDTALTARLNKEAGKDVNLATSPQGAK